LVIYFQTFTEFIIDFHTIANLSIFHLNSIYAIFETSKFHFRYFLPPIFLQILKVDNPYLLLRIKIQKSKIVFLRNFGLKMGKNDGFSHFLMFQVWLVDYPEWTIIHSSHVYQRLLLCWSRRSLKFWKLLYTEI